MTKIYDLILFDLDGTISDSSTGIARSINYALVAFGYRKVPEQELKKFVGPPIDETFALLANSDSGDFIAQMVNKFRERFSAIGYSENFLYSGVREVLTDLFDSNVPMAICTTKRADFAQKILEMFQIDSLFRFVNGGDIGIHKTEQIAKMLSDGTISPNTMMIGDRSFDLIAAHSNGIASAGVLWGYGSREELESENPTRLFSSPQELQVLKGLTKRKRSVFYDR